MAALQGFISAETPSWSSTMTTKKVFKCHLNTSTLRAVHQVIRAAWWQRLAIGVCFAKSDWLNILVEDNIKERTRTITVNGVVFGSRFRWPYQPWSREFDQFRSKWYSFTKGRPYLGFKGVVNLKRLDEDTVVPISLTIETGIGRIITGECHKVAGLSKKSTLYWWPQLGKFLRTPTWIARAA
jgi:hypothetical protein